MSNFLDKLKGQLSTVKASAKAAIVSPEIKESRLAICHACEFYFKPTNQCRKCGCIVSAKTSLSQSKCPIDKWSVIEIKKID